MLTEALNVSNFSPRRFHCVVVGMLGLFLSHLPRYGAEIEISSASSLMLSGINNQNDKSLLHKAAALHTHRPPKNTIMMTLKGAHEKMPSPRKIQKVPCSLRLYEIPAQYSPAAEVTILSNLPFSLHQRPVGQVTRSASLFLKKIVTSSRARPASKLPGGVRARYLLNFPCIHPS